MLFKPENIGVEFIFIFDKQTIGAVLTMALGGSCVLIEMFIGVSGDAIKDHLSEKKRFVDILEKTHGSLTETRVRSLNCWSVKTYLKTGASENIIKRNISCKSK